MPISDLLRGSNAGSNIDYMSAIPREGLGSVFLNYAKEQEEAKAKAAEQAEKIRQFNVTTDTANNRYEAEQARLAAKDAEDLRRYNLEKEQLKLDKEEAKRHWEASYGLQKDEHDRKLDQEKIGINAIALAGNITAPTLVTDKVFGDLGQITKEAAKSYDPVYNKFAEGLVSQDKLNDFNVEQSRTDRSVLAKPMSQAEALTEVISSGTATPKARALLGMQQSSDEEVSKRIGELRGVKNKIYEPITNAFYDEKKLNSLIKASADNATEGEVSSMYRGYIKDSGALNGATTATVDNVHRVADDIAKNSGAKTAEQIKAEQTAAQQYLTNTLSVLSALKDDKVKAKVGSFKLDSGDIAGINSNTPSSLEGVADKLIASLSSVTKEGSNDAYDKVVNFLTGNKASDVKGNMLEAFNGLSGNAYSALTPAQKVDIVRMATLASSAYGNADDWLSGNNSIAKITERLANNAVKGGHTTDEASMTAQIRDNVTDAYNATLNRGSKSASSVFSNYVESGRQGLTPPTTITTPTQTSAVPRQQAVANQTPVTAPSSTAVVEQPTAPATPTSATPSVGNTGDRLPNTRQVVQPVVGNTSTEVPDTSSSVQQPQYVSAAAKNDMLKAIQSRMQEVVKDETIQDKAAALKGLNDAFTSVSRSVLVPVTTNSVGRVDSLPVRDNNTVGITPKEFTDYVNDEGKTVVSARDMLGRTAVTRGKDNPLGAIGAIAGTVGNTALSSATLGLKDFDIQGANPTNEEASLRGDMARLAKALNPASNNGLRLDEPNAESVTEIQESIAKKLGVPNDDRFKKWANSNAYVANREDEAANLGEIAGMVMGGPTVLNAIDYARRAAVLNPAIKSAAEKYPTEITPEVADRLKLDIANVRRDETPWHRMPDYTVSEEQLRNAAMQAANVPKRMQRSELLTPPQKIMDDLAAKNTDVANKKAALVHELGLLENKDVKKELTEAKNKVDRLPALIADATTAADASKSEVYKNAHMDIAKKHTDEYTAALSRVNALEEGRNTAKGAYDASVKGLEEAKEAVRGYREPIYTDMQSARESYKNALRVPNGDLEKVDKGALQKLLDEAGQPVQNANVPTAAPAVSAAANKPLKEPPKISPMFETREKREVVALANSRLEELKKGLVLTKKGEVDKRSKHNKEVERNTKPIEELLSKAKSENRPLTEEEVVLLKELLPKP